MEILKVEELNAVYLVREGEIKAAVDISLEAEEGSITAVVGESASGKSTDLEAMTRSMPTNGRVLRETPFENIWIQPGAGDSGGAIGASLYVYNSILGNPRVWRMDNAYLGPSFSEASIREWLDGEGIPYTEYAAEELPAAVAKLIAGENVVGFYHGRM